MKFAITLVLIFGGAITFGQNNANRAHQKHLEFLQSHKLNTNKTQRTFTKTDPIYLDSTVTIYLDSAGNLEETVLEIFAYDKSLKKGTVNEYIEDDYRYKEVGTLDEKGNLIRLDGYRWEDSTQQYVKGIRSQSFRYNLENQLIEELSISLSNFMGNNDTASVELTKYYYASGILYLDTLFIGQKYADIEPSFETRYYYDGNNLVLEETKNLKTNSFSEKTEYGYSPSGVNISEFTFSYSNGTWSNAHYGFQNSLNAEGQIRETVYYSNNDQNILEPDDKLEFTYNNSNLLHSYTNSGYNPENQSYTPFFRGLITDRDSVDFETLIIWDPNYYVPAEYAPQKINEIKLQQPLGNDWKTVTQINFNWSNITSINEFAKPIALNVYPNPTAQELHIKQDLSNNYLFSVVNSNGQTMISGNIIPNDKLDVRSLKPGNYILSIKDGNKIYRSSFIKY